MAVHVAAALCAMAVQCRSRRSLRERLCPCDREGSSKQAEPHRLRRPHNDNLPLTATAVICGPLNSIGYSIAIGSTVAIGPNAVGYSIAIGSSVANSHVHGRLHARAILQSRSDLNVPPCLQRELDFHLRLAAHR